MIRILEAKPLEGHRLWIRFSDGLEGIYAVEPQRRGGVFMTLLNPAVFNAVTGDVPARLRVGMGDDNGYNHGWTGAWNHGKQGPSPGRTSCPTGEGTRCA
ncbi:MAG: DUF2442 domain-containing protein [Planctomycetes bacterium]|nr:DUF2442 domain-containing protein [Planctomycetota bacterium]